MKKIEIYTNVLPLGDLQAQGGPDAHLVIPDDLAPVLALLSVMTPLGPQLLNADVNGVISVQEPHAVAPEDVFSKNLWNNASITANQRSRQINTTRGTLMTFFVSVDRAVTFDVIAFDVGGFEYHFDQIVFTGNGSIARTYNLIANSVQLETLGTVIVDATLQ